MDQELFNPQSSSVSSFPNHLHPINLCPDIVAAYPGGRLLAGLLTHMYPRERIWCRFFASSFCLARENFPKQRKNLILERSSLWIKNYSTHSLLL